MATAFLELEFATWWLASCPAGQVPCAIGCELVVLILCTRPQTPRCSDCGDQCYLQRQQINAGSRRTYRAL
jgi:hypothetical protein